MARVATKGPSTRLGLALAPSDFGTFSGDLLVGNFGNGKINAIISSRTALEVPRSAEDSQARCSRSTAVGLSFGNGGPAGRRARCTSPPPGGESHGSSEASSPPADSRPDAGGSVRHGRSAVPIIQAW